MNDLIILDKQIVYKHDAGYYAIHKEVLLNKGYEILEDNKNFTIFILKKTKNSS